MKKLHVLGLAISAALCVPMAAHASDGTITFTGAIIDSTCSITGGGNLDVILAPVNINALQGVGTVAGATGFSISVTGCKAGTIAGYTNVPTKFLAYFESSGNIDLTTGRLNIDTGAENATGVQLQLLNSGSGSVINLAGGYLDQKVENATNLTSNFIVRYYATSATPTAGMVTSTLTYSLLYF